MYGMSIPISGGGYFRLFPNMLNKWFYKKYLMNEDNFVFYVHPFEFSTEPIPIINQLSIADKFRFQVGRKNNFKKLQSYLSFVKAYDVEFVTLKEYLKLKK